MTSANKAVFGNNADKDKLARLLQAKEPSSYLDAKSSRQIVTSNCLLASITGINRDNFPPILMLDVITPCWLVPVPCSCAGLLEGRLTE